MWFKKADFFVMLCKIPVRIKGIDLIKTQKRSFANARSFFEINN